MRAEALLDAEGFARVEAAIADAETRTSGEIVFVVVDRSEAHAGPRALFAAALAFAVGVLALALPFPPELWLPPMQLGAFGLGWLVAGRPALLRALLSADARRGSAERGAELAFVEEGVARTRDRTGILIYLALLEHQVVVLADQGIAARVPAKVWEDVVTRILEGIRTDEAERGLSRGIELCADILAEHLPPRDDNPNELPDPIRR